MRNRMHRRLAALETQGQIRTPNIEIWINDGDRHVHHPTGRAMTHEAFQAAFPNARRFTLDIFEERQKVKPSGAGDQ
jgi:hypothetical protein